MDYKSLASTTVMGAPIVGRGLVLSQAYQPKIYALPAASSKTNLLDPKHNTTLTVSTKNHVSLQPKLIEIVKHKLIYSAKILPLGRQGKFFRKSFNTTDWEKLLHASRCSIYTTAGPIAGILFVSTERVGFCSDRSLKTYSAKGDVLKFQYKVSIPLGKIKEAGERLDAASPSNKYVELLTEDDFSFWFLGLPNYKKTSRFLLKMMNRS